MRKNLSLKISFIIILITTIILTLFGVYRYQTNKARLNDQLNETLKVDLDQMNISLQNPLYDMDDINRTKLLHAVMNKKDVAAVYTWEEDNTTPSGYKRQKGQVVATQELPQKGDLIFDERKIVFNKTPVGKVRLYMTKQYINDNIRSFLVSIILQALLVDLILVTIVILIFNRIFVSPIRTLANTSMEISSGNLDASVNIKHRDDEIGVLSNNFIQMRDSIRNYIQELQKGRDELEIRVEKRTAELAAVNIELEKLSIVARETENSVMIMDAEGNFEWVNEGFTRLYDATLEQFKTKFGTNIVHSSTNPDIKNIIKKCKEEQKTINYESYTISKSGKKIWMQTTLTPIVNDNGTVTKLVVVESDITKIKETEEELSLKKDQLEEANKRLQQLATLDGLTGIANHRRFSEFYEQEWQRAIRSAKSISIILVDLDYFKLYNDTYGHQAGDECLRKIAQKLKKACRRPGDLAARYGGEEFILVLPETDVEGTNIIAERLRGEIEALKIPHKESTVSPHVTISLGCATYTPVKNDDSSSLIKAADMALYESKHKGRNRLTTSDSF